QRAASRAGRRRMGGGAGPRRGDARTTGVRRRPLMSSRLGMLVRRLSVGRRLLGWLPPRAASSLTRLAPRWIDLPLPFYEANDQGQMTAKERALVRDTVRRTRPRVCVELGTWHGGGSTYQVATALAQNGDGGLLHTYEPDATCLQVAVD